MSYYANNPCQHCEDRHVGCHSECEQYKAWKDEVEEKRQKRIDALQRDETIMQFKKTTNDRIRQKRGGTKNKW